MHFVAYCTRYPQFAFNVPALKDSYKRRNADSDSTVVRFQGRVLDTRSFGLTEKEADLVLERLKAMQYMPPLYGTDITVKEIPNGK